ncbi:hypothetical protein RSOL_490630, partial [Rhizoctonia solani AG-3 Rhs1AP]
MPLVPGTYLIHDTDSGRILTYYGFDPFVNKIGTWWYVKCYSGGSTYAIQGIQEKKYMAVGADGCDACAMEEDGAAILELQQSNDSYSYVAFVDSQATNH